MSRTPLARLINPENIAVVGGDAAEFTIRACLRFGFEGPIWGINPNRKTLADQPCFATVDDLPDVPDAVLIIVPAEPTIEIVRSLRKMEAGGAICFASGFRETGNQGRERQKELVEAADDMALIGPNCHGILNYMNGAVLWPDQHGGTRVEQGVAIVSQSGNMGINFTMQRRGLPLAALISLGNQAVCGVEDCVDTFLDDERIAAIGMHIEGLTDLQKFIAVAEKARDRGVPLVALKTGRSIIAAQISLGHTASLAGSDSLYDALFQRLGVARVDTVEDFLETLKLLSVIGPLNGNRLSSLSCSGGEAGLIADLAMQRDLEFSELTDQHKSQIQGTLNEYVSISNPLDYHTFIWGDEKKLRACFNAMFSGDFDLSLIIIDYPRSDRCDLQDWHLTTRAIIGARRDNEMNVAVISTMTEGLPGDVADELIREGIAPLQGIDQALSAIEGAVDIGNAWHRKLPLPEISGGNVAGSVTRWDEWTSKQWLAEAGFSVPDGRLCTSSAEAVEAARDIGGPVAIKVVSSNIVHKTEHNGVRLNINDLIEVERHAHDMLAVGEKILIEAMVNEAVCELIVGVSRDEQFGLYLIIGFGGTLVELINDSAVVLLPANRQSIVQALSALKMAPLLHGYRGGVEADMDALVDLIERLGKIALNHGTRLMEIDINPLLVLPKGCGVMVADAYMEIIEEDK